MARKRMLDPNIWMDEKFGQLNFRQRLLFIGIISNADDEGRFRANPLLLRSQIFPYDHVTPEELKVDLDLLTVLNLIRHWTHDKQDYGCLPQWRKYQKVQYPKASEILLPEEYSATPADEAGPAPPKGIKQLVLEEAHGSALQPETADSVQPQLFTEGAGDPAPPFIERSMNLQSTFNESSMNVQQQSSLSQSKSGQSSLDSSQSSQDARARGAPARDGDGLNNQGEKFFWTLDDDDPGGYVRKDVREAYERITKNAASKSDRQLIELLSGEIPFSSRAVVALMEKICARAAGKQIKSFSYFRASLAEIFKRCDSAVKTAAKMASGGTEKQVREIILRAVRREVKTWEERAA